MIGCSIWYGHKPLRAAFEKLTELGFEYFEVALDYPLPDHFEADDVRLAFHAPLDILLASPRREMFEASMKVLEKCLKFAAKFEPLYFNIHMFHFTPTFVFEDVRESCIESARKACEFAVRFGDENGFAICIENDKFFVEDFVCDEAFITLDIGHFAVNAAHNGKDYVEELQKFAKKHEKRILVLHIHDFDLQNYSDHIPLGKGDLDFSLLRDLMKIPKFRLVEVFWKDSSRKDAADITMLKRCLDIVRGLEKD